MREETYHLTQKEMMKLKVIEKAMEGILTVKEAAEAIGLSEGTPPEGSKLVRCIFRIVKKPKSGSLNFLNNRIGLNGEEQLI